MPNKSNLNLKQILEFMWKDYCALNPSAKKIHDLIAGQGEVVLNDHIALRTFQHPKVGIDVLAKSFLNLGYAPKGEYKFKEKKLFARHFEHSDPEQPKIFISELELDKISPQLRTHVDKIIDQIDASAAKLPGFTFSGRTWKMSHKDYVNMANESEYASWIAAFGYRPNHFTVNVNALKKFNTVQKVNAFLEQNGFRLNTSGGAIKGSPAELLEQSSTMAAPVPVNFTEGSFAVPACYYEFALRYPNKAGQLYQGFVATSADKIFESTNALK